MGSARRQQAKRNNRSKRSIPRSYFKAKPRGMKDAEVVGIVSKINKEHEIEKQEKRDRVAAEMDEKDETQKNIRAKIHRNCQKIDAINRETYHELRLSEATRHHKSIMRTKPASHARLTLEKLTDL